MPSPTTTLAQLLAGIRPYLAEKEFEMEMLGARPGGDQVARGRLLSIREARNCWRLEALNE